MTGDSDHAISWPAIAAGAVASIATASVLSAIAGGFDLTLASPWPGARMTGEGFTPAFGAALVTVQALAGAMGGYVAGRLRPHWIGAHEHEVHFRDTAHGFLAWALSAVGGIVLAALLIGVSAPPAREVIGDDPMRAAHLASQASLFMGVGLLLAAFVSSVAAAIGGMRRDDMHKLRIGTPL